MGWEEEYDDWHRELWEARRRRDELYEAQRRPGDPPLPPRSLSDWGDLELLDRVGGPIGISGLPSPEDVGFGRSCSEYPERCVLAVLMKYSSELTLARRHWPWVAHILHMYKASAKYHDPTKDLTPTEASNLLDTIRGSAERLERSLNQLAEAALLWRDDEFGDKGGHLEYLEQLLAQGTAGFPSDTMVSDPAITWTWFKQYRLWRSDLNGLIQASRAAQGVISADLLTSGNRSRAPGLKKFVGRCALIWKSLTGRDASAAKVHTRSRQESRFVLFVQEIAALSQGAMVPSMSQIASALSHHNKREK